MVGCKGIQMVFKITSYFSLLTGAESAVGILYYIDNEESWEWFRNKSKEGPYTLFINPTKKFSFNQ